MDSGQVASGAASAVDLPWRLLEHVPGALLFQALGQACVPVLNDGQRRAAYRCAACQTVVILTDEMTEELCLQCGETLGPGVAVCPKCGWTYQTTAAPP